MSVTVTRVRFEHHREALGIGEPEPRLSWIVESAPTGWRQVGYELEARPAPDVHRVDGPDSVLVPWPFSALASGERREVRVRVIGEDATASAWSDWAAVETGLLH